jgi:hypothetical protein
VKGRTLIPRIEAHEGDEHVALQIDLPPGATDIKVHYADGVGVILPETHPAISEASSAMKLISVAIDKNVLRLGLDVMGESANYLELRTTREIKSTVNAQFAKRGSGVYQLTVVPPPAAKSGDYQDEQVEVVFNN